MTAETPRRLIPLVCLCLSLLVAGCSSDTLTDTVSGTPTDNDTQSVDNSQSAENNQSADSNQSVDSSQTVENSEITDNDDGDVVTDNPAPTAGENVVAGEDFSVSLSQTVVEITEGADAIEVPVTVTRQAGHTADITLSVLAESAADAAFLTQAFTDVTIEADDDDSGLQLELNLAPAPIQAQSRTLLVVATDTDGQVSSTELTLDVEPTSAPDVYLLIGQSNMVGISEEDAKRSAAGELDAPDARIKQLNVTFNDRDNFSVAADFTDTEKLFNNGEPLTVALDPLHSGLQGDGTKSGTRIGMGLSFAKRALQDTTADIYLVPAAWSDTGFCKRDTNAVEGIGWNATEKDNDALSGTLLHDRAIARTDAALELTGGILRGILWHQGEADSDSEACAIEYADNLAELVESLRTNIQVDARGSTARGADADIPFIVGTMSMAGTQAPFSSTKLIVDGALRNVGSTVAFAGFVNNDDLVLPTYSCGGGSCIHFGSDALREMGARYYDQLRSLLP